MSDSWIDAELDELIEAFGLTADTATRIDNDGLLLETNGYLPVRTEANEEDLDLEESGEVVLFEEFFNKYHSKQDGRFVAGPRNRSKAYTDSGFWGADYENSRAVTGHAAQIMGIEGYEKYKGRTLYSKNKKTGDYDVPWFQKYRDSPKAREVAREMLKAIRHAPPVGKTLFSGRKGHNEKWMALKPGDEIDLPTTATTTTKEEAHYYPSNGGAILRFEGSTRAVHYLDNDGGGTAPEWVTAGRFKVVSVKQRNNMVRKKVNPDDDVTTGVKHGASDTIIEITLRQIATFDPTTKGFTASAEIWVDDVEEFFNQNHSKANGRFSSGPGGSSIPDIDDGRRYRAPGATDHKWVKSVHPEDSVGYGGSYERFTTKLSNGLEAHILIPTTFAAPLALANIEKKQYRKQVMNEIGDGLEIAQAAYPKDGYAQEHITVRVGFFDPHESTESRGYTMGSVNGDQGSKPSEINVYGPAILMDKLQDPYNDSGWSPSVANVSVLTYTVVHESGHILEMNKPEGAQRPHEASFLAGTVSRYAQSNSNEAYAEAFAEWAISKGTTSKPYIHAGDTTNPFARSEAERNGWVA